ncbi:DUF6705 family protein [Chryseobacterium sp. CT-SW4]|uniref:DUF6705 family protein n=1 Tax=Chryseobacterium sp. SW-1 TaxID=3157343 RepID=UPI003B01E948
MKTRNIILLLIMICFSMKYKSQTFNYSPGANNPNHNIDKFIGNWIWKEGGNTFELIFKKENISLPIQGNVRADALYGFHKYVSNNILIEDSTIYSNINYNAKKTTLLGYTLKDPNVLKGGITHLSKNNKNVEFEINYIDSTHIKLVKVQNYPGTKINIPGQIPYDSSISFPQNIILTKQ